MVKTGTFYSDIYELIQSTWKGNTINDNHNLFLVCYQPQLDQAN